MNKTVTSQADDDADGAAVRHLIIAAGAEQNYFGNDQFATFAPGMKTVDDALEVRGRILGAFGRPRSPPTAERTRRLTFVVVGGGPPG